MSVTASARVRMYRLHELGDCFMVTFSAGTGQSRLLIDCGSFRNGSESVARLQEITRSMAADLGGAPIDVVVGTHQHNDHLSGFVHCERAFRAMKVGQVWLPWLDNPADRRAKLLGDGHRALVQRLHGARQAFTRAGMDDGRPAARAIGVLDDVLGFYGAAGSAPPEVPAKAVTILRTLGQQKPQYLSPGTSLDMPGLPAGSVRVHVLGPPKDEADLFRANPKKGESYEAALASAGAMAARFLDAAVGGAGGPVEEGYPFPAPAAQGGRARPSAALRALVARYRSKDDAWRTVDEDWMQQAESLALFLDTYTNNSSLVLAVELVASRKVLLFAADAQSGNWSSWSRVKWADPTVRTDDLLARTVFYKVGHHASHNATLVDAFEKMTDPGLVALIPVHKKDPNIVKPNGWKMPAAHLLARIRQKTNGRVLQMDGVNPPDCNPAVNPAKAAWKKSGITPRVSDIAIDLDIP